MAFPVYHNVSVVSILDLQNIASNRIRCHRLDEVEARPLEWYSIRTSVLRHKEIRQIIDFGPTHFVPGGSIRNDIDDTTL